MEINVPTHFLRKTVCKHFPFGLVSLQTNCVCQMSFDEFKEGKNARNEVIAILTSILFSRIKIELIISHKQIDRSKIDIQMIRKKVSF